MADKTIGCKAWFKVHGYTLRLADIFTKESKFCDFLYNSRRDKSFQKGDFLTGKNLISVQANSFL